jgi:ABC-2 type transport system permease protein
VTSATTPARPPLGLALASLLRAGLAVLRRNWRLQFLNLGLPIFVLFTSQQGHQGKPVSADTAATLAGTAITVGLMAVGVFGYPLAVARDRESGVFQRLRVTPAPTWTIMVSRLVLQVAVNIVVTVVVAGVGAVMVKLPLGVVPYLSLIPAAIVAGAVFLGIGQALVGLLASAAQVNAVGRVVFIALLLIGVLGLSGGLGPSFKTVAKWYPVGSTVRLFHTILIDAGWTTSDTNALLACLGYVLVFSVLGIRYFRWDTH